MKKIILTGGGTAGHVMPNVGLLPYLTEYEIHYVGSHDGIEKTILAKYSEQVKYHEIRTGKLRRSITFENVIDFFRVIGGYFDSKRILKEVKPDVIFSKGGYVAVPIVLAARHKKIPIITHESDITLGLANKIIAKYATKVLTTFPETADMVKGGKGEYIGSPIREDIFKGDSKAGLDFLGFTNEKPLLAVMGGSIGSVKVNNAIRNNLDYLLERFNIVHMCGKGNIDPSIDKAGYKQYEFISDELPNVLTATDYVISRAGSNAIHEFVALLKPMILVPLTTGRGDQIANTESFVKRGFALSLDERIMTNESFLEAVQKLIDNADEIKQKQSSFDQKNGIKKIYNEIEEITN